MEVEFSDRELKLGEKYVVTVSPVNSLNEFFVTNDGEVGQSIEEFIHRPLVTSTVTPTVQNPRPATSTHVEQFTSTPIPVPTTTLQRTSTARVPANAAVTLLAPPNSTFGNGQVTFSWRPNFTLRPSYAFEVAFWRVNQDALRDGRGWGGSTTQNSVTIDFVKVNCAVLGWGDRNLTGR